MALYELTRSVRALIFRLAGAAVAIVAALAAVLVVPSFRQGRDDPEALKSVAREARQTAEIQLQSNQFTQAEQSCRQALAALDKLAARSPVEREYRRERAAVLDALGLVQVGLDQRDEAVPLYKEAIDLWSKLLAEDPAADQDRGRLAGCLQQLGLLFRAAGRWDEAESTFFRGRLLCENVPDRLRNDQPVIRERIDFLEQQGSLFLEMGRLAEAVECDRAAVMAQQALVDASPDNRAARERHVALLCNLATVFTAGRQPADAERDLALARDRAEQLVSEFPITARYHDLVATVLFGLTDTIKANPGRRTEARNLLERALAIAEKLVARSATSPGDRAKLAATCRGLAGLCRDQGSYDQAEKYYRQELAIQSRLAIEHPLEHFFFAHGRVLHNLADLLRQRGRSNEALPLEQAAVERLGGLYRKNMINPDYRRAFSYASWGLCALLLARNDVRATGPAVAEYLKIEPSGYDEALESARFLCRFAELCREDQSIPATNRDSLARNYADRSMNALSSAVQNGFRDVNDLKTSRLYEPLRGRDDFQRLVQEIDAELRAE